jgi:hypothetical protein
MVDYFGAAQSLLGGIGSFLGGSAAAGGSKKAAQFYTKAAALTNLETGIKETAATRQIYQTLGAQRADVAANGFSLSGSAADVMRDSAQQGALSKALIQVQGDVTASSYTAQAQAAAAQAKAQSGGGLLGGIGGLIGIGASLFSDDRLKSEITLFEKRDGGINRYRYRYENSDVFYVGVLASEVEMVMPEAVSEDANGYRLVNYDMIGVPLVVEGAPNGAA